MAKNLVLSRILAHLAKFGLPKIFSQILLHQSLDIMISYHHVLLPGKIYDPILKKFNDGWKDRQTDREVNGQERLDKMLFD